MITLLERWKVMIRESFNKGWTVGTNTGFLTLLHVKNLS